MDINITIKLDQYIPRIFQKNAFEAILKKGYKRVLLCWPRRAGKDVTAFNVCIRECLRKPMNIYYVFPTYSQAKKVIWDSITNEGLRFLDFIPREVIDRTNSQEMKIWFKNGSLLQLLGSDSYDTSLVGTNPQGIVFSEYALQDPRAYQFVRPILAANGGWAIFISTPRGKNHFWDLYQMAINSSDWFVSKLTVEDTMHIPFEEIEKERLEGIMSEDLIQQELYTSFEMGVEGAYYSKIIDKLKLKGQIGVVPYEPGFSVHTSWDLGVRDSTAIIFYQTIGQTIRIIDCYENSKVGLDHYAKVLAQKDYVYGKHFAPHDIAVTEFGSGISRIEKAKQLGIKFEIRTENERKMSAVPNVPVEDGIECVRSNLPRMWIDETSCRPLIKALENYRQEYDVKRKVYKPHPLHDNNSHFADAMRYLCLSLSKTRDGLSAKDLDDRYKAAMSGGSNLPPFFR